MSPAVEQILAEFFVARDSGRIISVTQLIAEHPEQAEELKSCLDLHREFEQFLTNCLNEDRVNLANRYPIPFGSYELLGQLGAGGMGLVFRAKHRATGRIVSLKMLRGGRYATAAELRRFHRESNAVMQLDHPNIVKVFTVDEWDGHAFFTMQLMNGGTLHARRWAHPMTPQQVDTLVAELADAVQHAHQRGILHRDIKPSNILFDDAGRAYLADFGLAKLVDSTTMGGPATISGTPGYMAPEQRSGGIVTTATDIYGLGGILHFLLTGKPPNDSATDTIHTIPRDLDAIRRKALAERPEDRYATAHEFKLDLQRYAAGKPVSARIPSFRERWWMRVRQSPVLSLFVLSTVLAILSTSYFAWRDSRSTRRLIRELANLLEVENAYRQRLEDANRGLVLSNACELFREGRTGEAGELMHTLPQLENSRPRGLVENLLNRWTAHERRWNCHDGVLLAMAVHPDGRSIATVGSEGRLVISDTKTGDRLRSWSLPRTGNVRIAYDSAGQKLVVTMKEDVQPSRFLVQIFTHEGEQQHATTLDWTWLHGAAWCTDGRSLLLSGQDRNGASIVTQWHAAKQQFQAYAIDPALEVHHLQSVPSGRFIGSTWSHHRPPHAEIVVFSESPTEPPVFHSLNYPRWITGCDVSPNGEKLAAITDDGNLLVIDRQTMKVNWQRKEVRELGWNDVIWSEAGETITFLLHATQGTEQLVVEAKTGDVRSKPSSIQGRANPVARNPKANQLFFATGDGKIQQRRAAVPVSDELHGHTGEVWTVAFAPDGQLLASGSDDSTIRLWDVATNREVAVLKGHTGLVMAVAFSPDGRRVYSTSWDQTIRVWDVASRTCLRDWQAHEAPIPYLAVSPDGMRLYTHARDGQTKAWDATTGQLLHTIAGDDRKSVLFALSGDGQQLVVSDATRQIKIWDTRTWTVATQIDQVGNGSGAGAFSRDGSELVFGRFAGVIETRNPKVGSTRTWYHDPATAPTRLTISGDDRYFLVANDPSSPAHLRVVLSHRVTGKPMLTLPHPKPAFGLAFSPDSKLIATGCHDCIVRIWGRHE